MISTLHVYILKLDEEMQRMDRREFVRIVKEYIPSEYLNKEPYKDTSKNRRRPKRNNYY